MNAADTQSAPSLAIRAKPPSPRRLSRKVLLGACLTAGAVIAFALISGLSDKERAHGAGQSSVQAAAGPPESIAGASSSYDTSALSSTMDDEAGELLPPEDPFWSGRGESAQEPDIAPAAPATRAPRSSEAATLAPLLFALERQSVSQDNEGVLPSRLQAPRSPFIVQAGQIIPAALVTGLNSDLPGQVIAQVTAPVYDSVTGQHLLIPQGSRLIGAYDTGVRHGDRRMLVNWTRLVLPNGWSFNLQNMRGADPSGASGLNDLTDNHLDRLAVAIGLSALISVVANESEDDGDDRGPLGQSVGDAAAQQAAQTGARIVDRELTVRPTLRVRPGATVRVLVDRDIVLRPYR